MLLIMARKWCGPAPAFSAIQPAHTSPESTLGLWAIGLRSTTATQSTVHGWRAPAPATALPGSRVTISGGRLGSKLRPGLRRLLSARCSHIYTGCSDGYSCHSRWVGVPRHGLGPVRAGQHP